MGGTNGLRRSLEPERQVAPASLPLGRRTSRCSRPGPHFGFARYTVTSTAPAAELGRSALKEGAVNAAVAVEPAAGAVTVRLAAYVHRSDGRPGFDPGSGWSRKMLGPAVRTNIATDRVKE